MPGDRPDRFEKAVSAGADAVIFDLEDAVSPDRKPFARSAVIERLASASHGPARLVRVNALDSGSIDEDLEALRHGPPDAIMLPKAEGATSVRALEARLAMAGLPKMPVLPIAAETPSAVFGLAGYRDVADALLGLTWGAEDLTTAVGASAGREPDGRFTPPYEIARALTLFAATAAATRPIETVYPAVRDLAGLDAFARRAARDGFTGMLAIHPDQVAPINAAFTPGDELVRRARAIVAAFAASPGAGAIRLDGGMIDAPHLKQARLLLERVDG